MGANGNRDGDIRGLSEGQGAERWELGYRTEWEVMNRLKRELMGSLGWEVAGALRWHEKESPRQKQPTLLWNESTKRGRCGRKWGARHRCCGVQ